MTKEQFFDVWAPPGLRWSPWVKPVLFACLEQAAQGLDEPPPLADLTALPEASPDLAFVVDLPGADGVWLGLALARRGFRPVPLYNALPSPTMSVLTTATGGLALVDVQSIISAVRQVTPLLRQTALGPEAPPAFLLDANRRGAAFLVAPGRFDNRSISFVTDFPSATCLFAQGVRRAILVQSAGDQPQPDLAHTLCRWQEAKIPLELLRVGDRPVRLEVDVPAGFGLLWQRALGALGLRRHALGGFGGLVPLPSAG